MGLMDILSGGMNLLDLPSSMIRDVAGGANPFDQLMSPFSYENRLGGRDVLERWGVLDQNQEGFDFGDVAGFAADVVMDPFVLGSLGRNLAGVGARQAAKRFGKQTATDMAVGGAMSAPAMAFHPQTQWDMPASFGASEAVNKAVGLPEAIQGPMTPWAAIGHNRKVNKMLAEGAMPADVARQTRARVVDPSLYDHLQGAARGSEDFQQLQKMQSDWEGTLRSQLEGVLPPEELERALERYVPAQLYHGTPHPYFDRVDLSKTSPGGLAGRGFYTTNIPAVADTYVNKGREWGGETLTLSPELLRKKMGSLLDEFGVSPSPESPHGLGTDLERFLSGDWNPGAIESKAMMRRLQNEMLSEKPFIDASGNYITDPRLAQDIKSRLQDIELASSLHNAPQPLHVQRVMMDSRNPLDLDADLPNPQGLTTEELFSEHASRVGQQQLSFDDAFADRIHKFVSENHDILPNYANIDGVGTPPYVFKGMTKDEVKSLINTAVKGDVREWATSESQALMKRFNIVSDDDLNSVFNNSGFEAGVEAVINNAENIRDAHILYGTAPTSGLKKTVDSLIGDIKPLAKNFKRLQAKVLDTGDAFAFELANIDVDSQLMTKFYKAKSAGNQRRADEIITALGDAAGRTTVGDRESLKSALNLVYDVDKRLLGSNPSRMTMDALGIAEGDLNALSYAVSPGSIESHAREDLAYFATTLKERFGTGALDAAQRAAIEDMRGANPTGWDLFNMLKSYDVGNTHNLFRELGYDALTHTGGQRSGNGELLHRVFIGLDPDKLYKGHGIAPDPVDVWTLQNVLTGMPAMSVPSRAAYAEARSAGY